MPSKYVKLWKAKAKALKIERQQWRKARRVANRKLLKLNTQIADMEKKIEYQLAKTK